MIRNVFTGGTIQRTNKQLETATCSTKNIEVWRHVTMGAKFLDLNNLSWQGRPFALSNYGRKVWAAILFLWETGHGKVLQCQVFRFFCNIWRIWNFTTFATRTQRLPLSIPIISNFLTYVTWQYAIHCSIKWFHQREKKDDKVWPFFDNKAA